MAPSRASGRKPVSKLIGRYRALPDGTEGPTQVTIDDRCAALFVNRAGSGCRSCREGDGCDRGSARRWIEADQHHQMLRELFGSPVLPGEVSAERSDVEGEQLGNWGRLGPEKKREREQEGRDLSRASG